MNVLKAEGLVEQSLELAAPRATVLGLVTQARGLLEWMAVAGEVEAVPGGKVRWRHENGATMCGHFVEVIPPRRVVFTYGWESGGPPVAPGSTLVTMNLEETGSMTRLHL